MDARTFGWLIDPGSASALRREADLDPDVFWAELLSGAARSALRDVEVLITGWGAPTLVPEVLDHAPHLRLVAHAAGTVKSHLPLDVWDRGIRVVSAAAGGVAPVAEFTLASILLANKHVLASRDAFRQRRDTSVQDDLPADRGNLGRVVGVVGASRIGRRVVEVLRVTDLDVVVHDPYLTSAGAAALGVERVPLPELLRTCDVVSLHAPSTPETRHMIGEQELALLRDGATLVNTARGALVDHDALTEHLVTGRLSAVLDVTEPEPLPAGSPLWDLPNVVLTPHVAGAFNPRESRRHLDVVVEELHRWRSGAPLQHEVRREALEHMA